MALLHYLKGDHVTLSTMQLKATTAVSLSYGLGGQPRGLSLSISLLNFSDLLHQMFNILLLKLKSLSFMKDLILNCLNSCICSADFICSDFPKCVF